MRISLRSIQTPSLVWNNAALKSFLIPIVVKCSVIFDWSRLLKHCVRFLHVMDEHSPFQLVERKGSNTSMGSRRRVSVDETGPPGSPVLITRSHNQARVIQDSLEKNERANDDLFQL